MDTRDRNRLLLAVGGFVIIVILAFVLPFVLKKDELPITDKDLSTPASLTETQPQKFIGFENLLTAGVSTKQMQYIEDDLNEYVKRINLEPKSFTITSRIINPVFESPNYYSLSVSILIDTKPYTMDMTFVTAGILDLSLKDSDGNVVYTSPVVQEEELDGGGTED